MISIEGLDFSYPGSDFRLTIPQLSIADQERVAIIGQSGFGKTTLLNLFAGILLPDLGTVRVDSQEVNGLSDKARRAFRISRIGFVFQDFKLLEYLRVRDNILLPYRINRELKLTKEATRRAEEVAESLDIYNKLSKYPSKLSQGERQRVAIGRALINEPQIILADEPTGNLDPKNKERIKQVLFESAKNYGATLITVTHDHELLEGFDRVIDFQDIQKPVNG